MRLKIILRTNLITIKRYTYCTNYKNLKTTNNLIINQSHFQYLG